MIDKLVLIIYAVLIVLIFYISKGYIKIKKVKTDIMIYYAFGVLSIVVMAYMFWIGV